MNWIQKNSHRLSSNQSLATSATYLPESQEESVVTRPSDPFREADERRVPADRATIMSKDSASRYSQSEYGTSAVGPMSPISESALGKDRRASSVFSYDAGALKDKILQRGNAMTSIRE